MKLKSIHGIRFPFAIPVVAASLGSFVAQAQFAPIQLTPESYNQDIVVEKLATPPLTPGFYTTASMDGGTNNNGDTWNEQGYFRANPDVGLPAAGSTVTSVADANHSYLFAPDYKTNNAIMLDASAAFTNVTVTLKTATAYTGLSFLTSGGNGGCIFKYVVHHQDGTTETGQSPSADWFNGANPAWIANGRVNAQSFTLDNFNSNNPRLYSKDVALTNSSPITSIDLSYVSSAAGAHTCIMAISGSTTAGGAFGPVAFTGYNADIVVEATAPERAALPEGLTTATMDGGTANTGATLYEMGYAFTTPTNGLPAPGSKLTNAAAPNHIYQLAPSYTSSSNAVLLDAAIGTATITPATPAAYSGLSFLALSGGGAASVGYTVTHADTTTETGTLSIPDWYNGTPIAYTLNGRVNHDSGLLESVNTQNPRVYGIDIPLSNTSSPVTQIDLTYNSGGRAAILAVSGGVGALPPTITLQPISVKANPGDSATFTVEVSGTQPITYQFQKGTNGVFVDVSNGDNISGAQTTELTINNVSTNDAVDYRFVAMNGAGSATSSVVNVVIISPLPVITTPSDSVTGFGGTWPDAENPKNTIDGTTTKYLNRGANNGGNPFQGPVGFVVTPSQGRTILQAVRFYTANDAPERDPADYKIEGSNNGGASYTLIQAGPLNLPTARNTSGAALDPIAQFIQQVAITNSTAYSTYRVSFNSVRDVTGGLMQIGEVEMLGTVDTSGFPFFSQQPSDVTGQVGGSVQLTAAASGSPAPTIKWGRVVGGVFTPLTDSATVSGSGTGTLTLSGLTTSAAGAYEAVASNTAGSATSSIVNVRIFSSLQDVTSPTDAIEAYGDESNNYWNAAGSPANVIDNTTSPYVNGGSGFSAAAGFPPFQGPAGFVVTPSVGATVVKGIRVYTADGNNERDPVSYTLEGSNDGTTFTTISSGPLSLPATRNATGNPLDPLTQAAVEVLFSNSASYTSYRLSFGNVANPTAANSVQVAEVELLGTQGASGPTLSISKTGSSVTITWTGGGTLEYITDLNQASNASAWTSTGDTSGSHTESASTGNKFFRVRQ